jgi:hypothetical protein
MEGPELNKQNPVDLSLRVPKTLVNGKEVGCFSVDLLALIEGLLLTEGWTAVLKEGLPTLDLTGVVAGLMEFALLTEGRTPVLKEGLPTLDLAGLVVGLVFVLFLLFLLEEALLIFFPPVFFPFFFPDFFPFTFPFPDFLPEIDLLAFDFLVFLDLDDFDDFRVLLLLLEDFREIDFDELFLLFFPDFDWAPTEEFFLLFAEWVLP